MAPEVRVSGPNNEPIGVLSLAEALRMAGELDVDLVEMKRCRSTGLCCGAGGAQMWKEEENGTARVNESRFAEAKSTGADTVAVGCPFCLTMMSDASKADGGNIQVKDVAEIVAERMK